MGNISYDCRYCGATFSGPRTREAHEWENHESATSSTARLAFDVVFTRDGKVVEQGRMLAFDAQELIGYAGAMGYGVDIQLAS